MAAGGVITNDGIKIIMDRSTFADGSTTYLPVSKFKVGSGDTTALITDTDIEIKVPITFTQTDDCDTADWTDDAECTSSLNSTTYKTGTGALNIAKDGGLAATCETHKTTTSVDFTSKELSLWLYIKDAAALAKLVTTGTPAVSIRFGSDNANYYEWEHDVSTLAVGWNLLDGQTSANADNTVGAPTIAACDYSYIEFEATGAAIVWSAGDFVMDDWKVLDSDDYIKSFETGYPTVNNTTKQVTYRTRLASTQANGYLLTEHGLFNEDGSPLMETRDVFTSFSKSDTDELIFVEKITYSNE